MAKDTLPAQSNKTPSQIPTRNTVLTTPQVWLNERNSFKVLTLLHMSKFDFNPEAGYDLHADNNAMATVRSVASSVSVLYPQGVTYLRPPVTHQERMKYSPDAAAS